MMGQHFPRISVAIRAKSLNLVWLTGARADRAGPTPQSTVQLVNWEWPRPILVKLVYITMLPAGFGVGLF